jgi:hypothetical protein
VAATLKWLEQSSWDYSLTTIDGLLTGEPVKETLEFSRRNLIRQLNNSEKELLYRLSIVGDSITREQALEIAYISPKITNPGNVLDYLTGPWLEQFENQKFNVTPLLADSGKENLEFEVQQAVHRLLVKQITKHKVIEITKVHTLLIHLWQAHDYREFGQVIFQAMMSVKTATQAKYIEWTTSVLLDTKWPKEFDLNLKLLIRAAQIRVASKAGKKIGKLNDDLEILIKQANPESNLLALLGVYSITGIVSKDLPADIAIPRSFSYYKLHNTYHTQLTKMLDKKLFASLPSLVWGQGMLAKKTEHTLIFLKELTNLNDQEIEILFMDPFALQVCEHLLNTIPFSELLLPVDERNWTNILTTLDELALYPVVQENLFLKVALARARSIVFADYLKDAEEAIKILEVFSDVSDQNIVFFLNYAKGCYSSDDGQIDRAIIYFTKAENSQGDGFQYYRVDNTRRLAIEKSRNKEWESAKRLCVTTILKFRRLTASEFEGSNLFDWDLYEMLGELAFIYWNLGNLKKASASFYAYAMKLIEAENVDDLRFKEAFNKAGHGLGWYLMLTESGNPPHETLDGDVYAPVTAGLFGIRRETLGKFVPPLGFSKALMLNQVARILYAVGLEKLAWYANKMALRRYQSENQENSHGLTLVYSDIAVLEMIYGDENVALDYLLLAIKFWAGARKSTPDQSKAEFTIGRQMNFSLITEDDLKTAERHLLYLFFMPVLLNWLSFHFSAAEVNQKISAVEYWLGVNSANIFYQAEWLKVIKYYKSLINYRDKKGKPDINFEVFGDRTTFQILWLFISSIYEKIPLKESFTNQVSALTSLVSYGSICSRMLPGFGRILHQYWLSISKTQRFALHDPQGFAELMDTISPSLGGRTIIKVIRGVSTALQVTIPIDIMENLNGLVLAK